MVRQGRYLVWSDIPNNRQLRYMEDDGRVSVFRQPSNNSNGNTFDHQGRQISCEHRRPPRRALRARRLGHRHRRGLSGQAAEFAERRRAPIPTAASGSPIRRSAASLYEGMVDAPGGLRNPQGLLNGRRSASPSGRA